MTNVATSGFAKLSQRSRDLSAKMDAMRKMHDKEMQVLKARHNEVEEAIQSEIDEIAAALAALGARQKERSSAKPALWLPNRCTGGKAVRLYRLVHQDHSPVTCGARLVEPSSNSNQKLGDGMYFALTAEDARRFHGLDRHSYTHMLACDVPFREDQFFDLRKYPDAIIGSKFSNIQKVNERHVAFCDERQCVGIIWQALGTNSWCEAVILSKHIGHGFEIAESTPL